MAFFWWQSSSFSYHSALDGGETLASYFGHIYLKKKKILHFPLCRIIGGFQKDQEVIVAKGRPSDPYANLNSDSKFTESVAQ